MTKILITDDDPFVAGIYQTRFQAEGFDVSVAGDGPSAIRQLAANPPDVVLLDLILPQINGVEVLKFIRSSETLRNVPVLVVSSSVAGELVEAAKKAGANKLLSKAMCSPRHVVEEVRKVLDARPSQPDGGDYENDVRVAFRHRVPPLIAELQRLQILLHGEPAAQASALLDLSNAAHKLSKHSTLAGFTNIARMTGSLEMLLDDLQTNPRKVTRSTLRTVSQVVDFIPMLLRQDGSLDAETAAPLILVLDDDPISGDAVCKALERANLRALAFEDPLLALRVMEKNRFDLIFLDVDMPRMSGLDMCLKLRATRMNAKTPVVIVTALNDFETRSYSETVGATDFIAKPIVMIEVAVKAVLHLLQGWVKRTRGARSEERRDRAA
ncbi:MAG TPA: response regulator [Thermoanaerobaculia bacterium]|jgi:DNA-binding response OmpR family regulator|nr:response regulator [Thermoanaerobaculia bacterium]